MEKIRFSFLGIGKKFFIDNVEYIKTNFGRGYRIEGGKKVFKNVKKEKIVDIK